MFVCLLLSAPASVSVSVCASVCFCVSACVCLYICLLLCVCVCLCVCICLCVQELSRQSELQAAQAVLLLQRAAEIQLGPQNQAELEKQARALSEQAQRVEQGLRKE